MRLDFFSFRGSLCFICAYLSFIAARSVSEPTRLGTVASPGVPYCQLKPGRIADESWIGLGSYIFSLDMRLPSQPPVTAMDPS